MIFVVMLKYCEMWQNFKSAFNSPAHEASALCSESQTNQKFATQFTKASRQKFAWPKVDFSQ